MRVFGFSHARRAVIVAVVCLACGSARAQPAATLDRYRPAPLPEDGFALSGAQVIPHLALSAQLHLEYANDPLVYENVAGQAGSELVTLVSDQLSAHAVLALGLLDTALLYIQLPVNLVMQGDRLGGQPTATGAGGGDLLFGTRIVLHRGTLGSAAFQLGITAPTAEGGSSGRPGVAGDAGASVHPEITSEIAAGPLTLLVDVGARWRKDVRFAGARFSDVLTYGLGVSVPLVSPRLRALAEVRGETPLDDVGDRATSPLEALLGLKLSAWSHWTFGAAGGAGLLRGYGSPDARFVLMAGYASAGNGAAHAPVQKAAPAPPPPKELPVVTAPIEVAPVVIEDRDRDGVADADDACPSAPGTQAGCPRFLRYDEAGGEVVLLTPLRFEGATLRAGSEEVIAELVALLRANPKMTLRLEAHLSRSNAARKRLTQLSVQRATVLAEALIANGIAAIRLEAVGCGNNRPLVPDHGSHRAQNERITIYVLTPLPPAGLRSMVGCTGPELPKAPPAPPIAPPPAPTAVAAPAPAPVAAPAPAPKPAPAPVPAPAPAPKPAPAPAAPPAAAKPTAAPAAAAAIVAGVSAAAVLAAVAREPGADADHDGSANGKDECPLQPGAADAHGCPPNHRLDLDKGTIELLKPVHFDDDSAALQARSRELIDEVAGTLRANPQMKVAIESHVAEANADAARTLTQQRAANVRKRFAEQGIAPARIKAYGCGQARPIAPNNVPWGRKKNDRIELLVLDPAPSSGVHSFDGCTASE